METRFSLNLRFLVPFLLLLLLTCTLIQVNGQQEIEATTTNFVPDGREIQIHGEPDAEADTEKPGEIEESANSTAEVNLKGEVTPPVLVHLHRCEDANVTTDFLELPEILRIPYLLEKLDYFKAKYRRSDLFNFTLRDEPYKIGEKCASGESFDLNVSMVTGYAQNPHFNFTPDGFLGYYRTVDWGARIAGHGDDESWAGGVTSRREELFIHPENFCVARITDDSISLKVCKSQCFTEEKEIGEQVCIPKCCTLGQAMTPGGCTDTPKEDWLPDIYFDPNLRSRDNKSVIYPNFFLNYYNFHWNCTTKLLNTGHTNDEFRYFSNGRLYTSDQGNRPWHSISHGGHFRQFCADGFWDRKVQLEYDPNSTAADNIVQSCKKRVYKDEEADERLHLLEWTYPRILFGVTLISALIHLSTVTVYLILVKGQNVHGWTILSFSACQLLLNVLLVGHFGAFGFSEATKELGRSLNSLCITYGILHQFLLISSFSWSTALTFDVWSKIQSMTPTSRNYKGKKRFLSYCLFAFGVPLTIVLISIISEFATGSSGFVEHAEFPGFSTAFSNSTSGHPVDNDLWIRPKYKETCIILGGSSYLVYISLPITAFLAINMIFALLTVKVLWDAKKNVNSFKDSSTSASLENQAKLVGKLFILMGVFLFFEILLTFWTPIFIWLGFAFFDFYRIVNALALFWIFVLNKRIPSQLSEKFPSIKRYVKTMTKTEQSVMSTATSNHG